MQYATEMIATILDGKALAGRVREDLAGRVKALKGQGRKVRLDAVLVGREDSPGAAIYARNQASNCEKLGIDYVLHEFPGQASHEDVAGLISKLNADDQVTAIMVHL
ncbi:MAG: bifunctional 5,10-methylene-tetrahydrofolate dehydrogenase/5,10-methylene-tetrahydrofolate cyclohydrolase, partial [Planctomycetota bacterium]|nr:bifunctional 5,10-methylene-tetrahydrofolate dehydrogenase/5,10-methylene-tetrahydrofolate cyclohydrolase [Planctomycetota bacterium]